jgi:hypothetical protein
VAELADAEDLELHRVTMQGQFLLKLSLSYFTNLAELLSQSRGSLGRRTGLKIA